MSQNTRNALSQKLLRKLYDAAAKLAFSCESEESEQFYDDTYKAKLDKILEEVEGYLLLKER